jgi:hypothetical protein
MRLRGLEQSAPGRIIQYIRTEYELNIIGSNAVIRIRCNYDGPSPSRKNHHPTKAFVTMRRMALAGGCLTRARKLPALATLTWSKLCSMARLFTPLFLKVDENPGGRAPHYLAGLQITPASRSQYRLTITAAPVMIYSPPLLPPDIQYLLLIIYEPVPSLGGGKFMPYIRKESAKR